MSQKNRGNLLLRNARFFKSYLLRRPVWCSWQLTDKCNFRCQFCSVWKKEDDSQQLDLQEIALAAEKLAKIGPMMVSLTGGEPLMRNDLPEIINIISRYHYTFISTNGSLVTREKARELVKAGLWGVGVSVDYARPALHDENRQFPGAYERALNALEIFQNERKNGRPQVNLMFTLMKDNLQDIEKLAEITKKIGCSFRVQAYSNLKTHDNSLQYPRPVSQDLLALHKKYPHFITNQVVLEKFDQAITTGVPDCIAGLYMINIDPRGYVSICPENQDNPVGHILRDDNDTLLANLKEKHNTNRCQSCWYNCRNELEVCYSFRGMWFSGKRNTFHKSQM